MSGTPEAAASLFGSSEESADPFAVIGTSSAEANPEASGDLFSNDEHSSFLGSVQQDSGLAYQHSQYAAPPPSNYQAAPTTWTQSDVVNEVHQYQSSEGSRDVHHYPQTPYAAASIGHTVGGHQSQYNPSSYQPYAAAPVQAPAGVPNTHASTVDKYAPTTVTKEVSSYSQYDYAQPTTTTTYSQYAPSAYSVPAPAAGSVSLPPTTVSPPAAASPPLPKASVNRPRVVNAYDPPFPTTTRKPSRQTSASNYGAYGVYQPAQALPPPSPFYATNQFSAQQSQPPPPSQYSQYAEPPKPRATAVRTQTPDYGPSHARPASYGHSAHPVARIQTPDYGPPATKSFPYAQPATRHQTPPLAKPSTLSYTQPAARVQTPDYGPLPPAHQRSHNRTGSYGQALAPPQASEHVNGIYGSPSYPSQAPPAPPAPARSDTLDSVGNNHVLQSDKNSFVPQTNPLILGGTPPHLGSLNLEEPHGYSAPADDNLPNGVSENVEDPSDELSSIWSQDAGTSLVNGQRSESPIASLVEDHGYASYPPTPYAPVTLSPPLIQSYGEEEDRSTNHDQSVKTNAPEQSSAYDPPSKSHAPQQLSAYDPPSQSYVPQQPLAHSPPQQSYAPQQSTYDPPTQAYLPQKFLAYDPPSQPYAPQQSSVYVPRDQTYAPEKTSTYAPSHSYAPQQSSAYAPPGQIHAFEKPSTYAPPSRPYAPQQPSMYDPPSQSFSPERSKLYALPPHPTHAPPTQTYAPEKATPYSPPTKAYALEQPMTVYDPYTPTRSANEVIPAAAIPNSTSADAASQPYAAANYKTQLASPPMVSSAYAPSPSLIGANDPLSRVSGRAPVFSFGFGGRFVTCFHGAASLNTGFDVALSSRNTTSIKIHTLNKLLPKSALSQSEAEYPGPLFADPGSSSIGLVRPTAATQAKSKKARVIQYLETRVNEINRGLGYLNPGDRRTAEAQSVLMSLLKIMVENDGKLSGSTPVDNAVRSVLVPRLSSELGGAASMAFSTVDAVDPANSLYAGSIGGASSEKPISVMTLRPSVLNQVEDLLIRGERKQAYVYALDQKLWAHAMVIASSIDKDAWKEVVNEFLQTELGQPEDSRESLRVAYRYFSGQGAVAVQELIPKQPLSHPGGLSAGLAPPSLSQRQLTPRTPGFSAVALNPPPASLAKWRETVAMIIASPPIADASITLTALGDQLLAYNWLEAAHVCYLLSPLTSPLGGSGTPTSRITLLASKPPHVSPTFVRNLDNIILSEILEFALSLAPTVKGQEPFGGIAHLQAYRLIHAVSLAELGYVQEANRYCEAISASLMKPSPYFTPTFAHQLRSLVDYISGVSHSDKSNSWIGGKISKPSLDSIGGWLEGRFTKLVTGDGEEETPKEANGAAQQRPFDGPFAHYSTISTAPSARSSPQPRPPNANHYSAPQRTSSAMAMSSPYQSYAPIDRASSAIDYLKHNKLGRQSPAPPVPPLPPHLKEGLGLNTKSANGSRSNTSPSSPLAAGSPSMDTPVQPPQASSWWDYSSGDSETPTTATFMKVDNDGVASTGNEGFISLMDSQNFGYMPAPSSPTSTPRHEVDDDMGDLGIGTSRKKDDTPQAEVNKPAEAPKQEAPAEKKQEQSNGWLSRWWKSGKEEGPAPVKANLGEENSFYFDKDLKRWVNKKAGAEEPKPAPGPPPPPSRAQTASPSKAAAMRSSPLGNGAPPPRSSSAMGMLSEAPAPPVRVRSNLVPAVGGASTPPPPMGGLSSRPSSAASMGPPGAAGGPPGSGPPSRPRSQATKKNLRSRYVDVFQQEAGQ